MRPLFAIDGDQATVYGAGMKLNPAFVFIFLFLLIGLIWSGGHVAWLIALGVQVAIGCVITALETMDK